MAWCEVARWRGWKISDLLIMVPNGAYLGADAKKRAQTMARLKRSGFRNGVFDYLLPVPIWSRTAIPPEILMPGLWLELKRTIGGRSSEDQAEFQGQMELFGWKCVVAKRARPGRLGDHRVPRVVRRQDHDRLGSAP